MNNDLIIQFARLWGQHEVLVINAKDEEIADMLKAYDSEELQKLLQSWADEFMSDKNNEDTVEFFEQKLAEMYEKECCELVSILNDATERSEKTDTGVTGKDYIAKE